MSAASRRAPPPWPGVSPPSPPRSPWPGRGRCSWSAGGGAGTGISTSSRTRLHFNNILFPSRTCLQSVPSIVQTTDLMRWTRVSDSETAAGVCLERPAGEITQDNQITGRGAKRARVQAILRKAIGFTKGRLIFPALLWFVLDGDCPGRGDRPDNWYYESCRGLSLCSGQLRSQFPKFPRKFRRKT